MLDDMAERAWQRDGVLAGIDLSGVRLVTVDVFDTLLFRRCGTVEGVFALTARVAHRRGLLDPGVTEDAFVILRRGAEARARRQAMAERGSGEVTLDDIHRHNRLPGVGSAALAALEEEVERRVAVANPYLASYLRHLRRSGRPVVLLSDMYLPSARLAAILAAAGLAAGTDYDALRVSCDEGVAKADGRLFRRLLAGRPDLAPSMVLHIGDNPAGDKAAPEALGMRAVRCVPPAALVAVAEREAMLGRPGHNAFTLRRHLAMRAVPGGAGGGDPEEVFWTGFGCAVMGPVAVHCANWVVRDAARRGIRCLAPLMREGELLGALMAKEARRLGLDLRVVPLHASRAALYLPSLRAFGEAELAALCTGSVFRTLADLYALLGLGPVPPSLRDQAGTALVDLHGAHRRDGSGPYEELRQRLLAPDTVARILERARQARRDLVDHLRDALGGERRVALVDIGARATMFARLMAIPELDGLLDLHGYLFYAVPDALDRMGDGVPLSVFAPLTADGLERARIVYRSPQFLELLLNGEAPTTVGYRRGSDGRVAPVTEPPAIPDPQRRAIRACRAGIDLYHEVFARLEEADGGGGGDGSSGDGWLDDEAPDVFAALHRAVHLPTPEEAERIGRLVYDINDGTRAVQRLCTEAAAAAVAGLRRSAPPASWLSLALLLRPSDLPWPQGAITLQEPGHVEALLDGAGGAFGHRAISRQFAHMAASRDDRRVVLCAAGGRGGMAPTFIEVARAAGLDLAGCADLLVAEPDGLFDGVPVLPLERVATQDCRSVVVVSVGYGQAILDALAAGVAADGRPLRCFWFDGRAFHTTELRGESPGGAG